MLDDKLTFEQALDLVRAEIKKDKNLRTFAKRYNLPYIQLNNLVVGKMGLIGMLQQVLAIFGIYTEVEKVTYFNIDKRKSKFKPLDIPLEPLPKAPRKKRAPAKFKAIRKKAKSKA